MVISKMLKMTGGTHANSRFERDIGEAAAGCFFKFCIRVHSASDCTVHANSASDCTVHANSANSLALSRTVQVNCTVHSNSASELHCSREQCNSLALFG